MSEVKKVVRVSLDGKKCYDETITDTGKGFSIHDSHFQHKDGDQMAQNFSEQVAQVLDDLDLRGGIFVAITTDGRPAIVSCINGLNDAKIAAYNAGRGIMRNATLAARSAENYESLALQIGDVANAFNLGCSQNLEPNERPYFVEAVKRHNKRVEEGE